MRLAFDGPLEIHVHWHNAWQCWLLAWYHWWHNSCCNKHLWQPNIVVWCWSWYRLCLWWWLWWSISLSNRLEAESLRIKSWKCQKLFCSEFSVTLSSCPQAFYLLIFYCFLPYMALISMFCLTDGTARILLQFLSAYLPATCARQQALWERVHVAGYPRGYVH